MRIAGGIQLSPTQNLIANGMQASARNAAASSYLPSDNPASLVAWFRMGVGVTVTGAGVSTWADQSGNGNDLLQATDTNRPAYDGSAIITFDGADNFMRCVAFTLNQPTQVSMLMKEITGGNTKLFCDGNIADTLDIFQVSVASSAIRLYAGALGPTNSVGHVGSFMVLTALFSGAASSLLINADTLATGNAGANNAGGFTLGSAAGGGDLSNIAVKEIILRDVDDAAIRADDHAYLQTL
ncbi:MAG: hypothetical protein NUV51_03840 [Sulfuricaulis sp.]|nr:hypothetical protein [Sulfuricaulis sp.]